MDPGVIVIAVTLTLVVLHIGVRWPKDRRSPDERVQR